MIVLRVNTTFVFSLLTYGKIGLKGFVSRFLEYLPQHCGLNTRDLQKVSYQILATISSDSHHHHCSAEYSSYR